MNKKEIHKPKNNYVSGVPYAEREADLLQAFASHGDKWVRPLDLGASSASHHTRTMRVMLRRGIVERRPRGNMVGEFRTLYLYRLTTKGREHGDQK